MIAGGVDTLDFSSCNQGFFIALDSGLTYSADSKTGFWLLSQNSSVTNLINDLESSYENVIGTAYADVIYGNSLNNFINAGLGNDLIYSSAGNDIIDCAGDIDTCIYSLSRSNYTITYSSGTYSVTALSGNEGTDTVTNVEYFQFADQIIAVSNLNQRPTGSISISGDLIEGRTLTAQNNFQDADGIVGNIEYWWFVTTLGGLGRVGISDTPSSSYVLKSSDIGRKILVQAVYTDGLGNTESVDSELVGVGPVLDDSSNPISIIFSPFDTQSNIPVDSNIVVTFSEAVKFGSGNIEIHQGSANGILFASYSVSVPGSNLSISDTVLTINPTNNLIAGVNYYVTFSTGSVQDLAGNNFSGINTYDFTTALPLPLTLLGTSNVDTLTGGFINDTLTGLASTDILNGGEDSDLYIMTLATDHPAAEINDTGVNGTDEVRFTSTTANQTLTLFAGDHGIEKVTIGTGTATEVDRTGTTALNVNSAAVTNALHILGNNGNNSLTGTAFNNTLDGGAGNDTLIAGAGNDLLDGGLGNDTMTGGAGDDQYIVDSATDIVTELALGGNDVINTTLTTFTLGANVEDLIYGGSSNFTGTGNAADNYIEGDLGDDKLNGGAGNDTLTGGVGSDTFIFGTALNSLANVDTITDFTTGDKIQLSRAIFTTVGLAGNLNAEFFQSGTVAIDANDRIIYNSSNGGLYYDADGSGVGAQIQFATLIGLPAVTNADFVIVA